MYETVGSGLDSSLETQYLNNISEVIPTKFVLKEEGRMKECKEGGLLTLGQKQSWTELSLKYFLIFYCTLTVNVPR